MSPRVSRACCAHPANSIRLAIEHLEPRLALVNVGGVVFLDANHNGQRDAGEQGMGGIVVYDDVDSDGMYDHGDETFDRTNQGNYSIPIPEPRDYVYVRTTLRDGFALTAPLQVEFT